MTPKEKSNIWSTVKTGDGQLAGTDNYQSRSLTKYFIIISALLFTITIANLMLARDTVYIKVENDKNDGHILVNNFTLNAGDLEYIDIMLSVSADVCTSPDCMQAAARLSNYMDSDVSPCEDFYQYSCGGWEKTHSIPSDQGHWDIIGELAQKNYNYFLELLSDQPNQNDSEAIVKAKRIFTACNNSKQIVEDELEAIRYIINITGGWDRTDITQNKTWSINSNLPLERYHGSFAFFGFGITPDDYNSTKPDIEISEFGLTLALPDMYKNDNLFNYIKTYIARILTPVISNGDAQQIADNIANFERELAFSYLPFQDLSNVSVTYNPLSLRNLTLICPEIDWVNYFNTIFDLALGSGQHHVFTGDDVIIVKTVDYFSKLSNLLKSTSQETVRDYAKWQLLAGTILFVDLQAAEFHDYLHKNHFSKLSKLGDTQPEICVRTVEVVMPYAVIRRFADNFISSDQRKRVNDTANAIQKAFIERIMEKDWLDSTTKQRCVDKVNSIIKLIAYPDFIENDNELDKYYADLQFPADADYYVIYFAIQRFELVQSLRQYGKPENKSQWTGVPTDPNVFYYQDMVVYNQQYNHIGFAATPLQSPFIMADWPPSLLFGAMGMIIGRVITHGFDSQGQQYDENGYRTQWWTNASTAAFNSRTKCFVDQYNNYKLQGVPMNGTVALDENIADSGGIHIAFQAYRDVNMNQTLPNINLSNDEIFFVSFGQIWCSLYTTAYLEQSVNTQTFSPGPIRVLGSLHNSLEFSKVFNCPPPEDQCVLW